MKCVVTNGYQRRLIQNNTVERKLILEIVTSISICFRVKFLKWNYVFIFHNRKFEEEDKRVPLQYHKGRIKINNKAVQQKHTKAT